MALKSRKQSFIWTILKFLLFVVRFLGMNGLIAAAVGLILWQAFDFEEAGPIVVMSGLGAVALALLVEVRGLAGGCCVAPRFRRRQRAAPGRARGGSRDRR